MCAHMHVNAPRCSEVTANRAEPAFGVSPNLSGASQARSNQEEGSEDYVHVLPFSPDNSQSMGGCLNLGGSFGQQGKPTKLENFMSDQLPSCAAPDSTKASSPRMRRSASTRNCQKDGGRVDELETVRRGGNSGSGCAGSTWRSRVRISGIELYL